jgi:hypothetical protein
MFKSKSVTSKVGDVDVEFYSLSFPVLFALKSAVGPISKVLSGFFRSARHDVGRFEEHSRDKDGAPVKIIQQQPITPEMAKLRAEQSQKTMQDAVEAIFAESNKLLIGRILMDSMRGICKRKPETKEIEEFLADLDLGQVVEMLQGVVKANAEVFGPLAQGWAAKAQSLLRAQASSESPTSPEQSSGSESSAQGEPSGPRLVPKG